MPVRAAIGAAPDAVGGAGEHLAGVAWMHHHRMRLDILHRVLPVAARGVATEHADQAFLALPPEIARHAGVDL